MTTFKKLLFIFSLFTIIAHFSITAVECLASSDKNIAFIRDGNVWIAPTDGTNAKPLTFFRNSRHPSISPDGKLIVFTSGYDTKTGFGRLYSMTPQC